MALLSCVPQRSLKQQQLLSAADSKAGLAIGLFPCNTPVLCEALDEAQGAKGMFIDALKSFSVLH